MRKKKKKMTKICIECGTTENLIYSGTDAWILGCVDLTEKICYQCAHANYQNKKVEENA